MTAENNERVVSEHLLQMCDGKIANENRTYSCDINLNEFIHNCVINTCWISDIYAPPHSASSLVVTFIITLLSSSATQRVFFAGQVRVVVVSKDAVVVGETKMYTIRLRTAWIWLWAKTKARESSAVSSVVKCGQVWSNGNGCSFKSQISVLFTGLSNTFLERLTHCFLATQSVDVDI